VIRWCAQLRQTGKVAPLKQGGDRRSHRIEAQAVFILSRIAVKRDITLKEVLARSVGVSIGAQWAHASEQERADVVIERDRWRDLDPPFVLPRRERRED